MTKPSADHLRALEFIRNKPVSLVCTKVNGVSTAIIAHVSKAENGTLDIEPIAILCNEDIFRMIEPPGPDDTVIIETEEEDG